MAKIIPITAFQDNYIWLILGNNNSAIVVDPGEATPVLGYLEEHQITLSAVFITHHHFDHCGGVAEILNKFDVPVYGGKNEPIPGMTHPLQEGDKIKLDSEGLPQIFEILEIPGHTLGHIAYLGDNKLFSGDTLFTAGCGRLFEGTPEQMLHSLKKLKVLHMDTEIYCGHEYTLENLKFARLVESENIDIENRLQEVTLKRQANLATVPAFLEIELKTNPFLRTDQKTVIKAAEKQAGRTLKNEVEVFAVIRDWKNSIQG